MRETMLLPLRRAALAVLAASAARAAGDGGAATRALEPVPVRNAKWAADKAEALKEHPRWELAPRPNVPEGWECVPDTINHLPFQHDDGRWAGMCEPGYTAAAWFWTDPYVPPDAPTALAAELGELLSGKTTAVLGDSLMQQWMGALECEAKRTFALAEGGGGDDFHKLIRAPPSGNSLTAPVYLAGPPGGAAARLAYRSDRKFTDPALIQEVLDLFDVVVINIGVHYNNMTTYREDMERMLPLLEAHGAKPGKAALFFESTAQHFAGDAGTGAYAQRYTGETHKCTCGPIQTALNKKDPDDRNNIVRSIAASLPHVHVVPLFNLTAPRWNLHNAGSAGWPQCDCTHYCYSPPYYHLTFAALRAALCTALDRRDGACAGEGKRLDAFRFDADRFEVPQAN